MKRILLAGTALVGVAALATPAHADLKLDLGGYFRGYAVYADNDETGSSTSYDELRTFEFKKDAEVHFTGETTTDMGLTVGVHAELKLIGDGQSQYGGSLWTGGGGAPASPGAGPSYFSTTSEQGAHNSIVDESYIYFSGGWGRVNFGSEDGAAYLLQVAAPSADSNVDGLRPTIQGFSMDAVNDGLINNNWWGDPATGYSGYYYYSGWQNAMGYDNALFRQSERITYLTPKWNGFQAGVSYAPTPGQQGVANNNATSGMSYNDGSEYPLFDNLWELAARWDGEFSGVGISAGGGYSRASNSNGYQPATGWGSDNWVAWDAGLNLTWQGWSLGAAYLVDNTATTGSDNEYRVWDVGLGWDNGPWHAGASWWRGVWEGNAYGANVNGTTIAATDDLQVDRYTVGGGYTYGPGMSFRGAVAWLNVDNSSTILGHKDPNPVQVTLGTDVNF